MSRFLTHNCFEPGSPSGADVLGLAVRFDLGFEPGSISSSTHRRRITDLAPLSNLGALRLVQLDMGKPRRWSR